MIKFNSENELLTFYNRFKNKKLDEISSHLDKSVRDNISTNKGMVGQIFEGLTGRIPNNNPSPDIENLGIELKVLPLKKGQDGYMSKERSKIKNINYKNLFNEDWKRSKLKAKINKILFNAYEHPIGARFDDISRFKYLGPILFNLGDSRDYDIIKSDWEKIKEMVMNLNAHLLSESLFIKLSASTSGTGRNIDYHKDALPAKERSYSFKVNFLNNIYHKRLENLTTPQPILQKKFEHNIKDIINDKINGKTIGELTSEYNFQYKNPKNTVFLIIKKILKKNGNYSIEDIKSNGVTIKTVPVNPRTLTPWEDMSFPKMSLVDLLYEEWDATNNSNLYESSLKVELENKFIFVPIFKEKERVGSKYKFQDYNDWKFARAIYWKPSNHEIEGIKKEWEFCKSLILNNQVRTKEIKQKNRIIQANNLLKGSKSEYIHIRPHTSDSNNIDIYFRQHTNGKISICWQSFWLNKKFVGKIIKFLI
jgi:DNA mismatch repair endonuclease MutH